MKEEMNNAKDNLNSKINKSKKNKLILLIVLLIIFLCLIIYRLYFSTHSITKTNLQVVSQLDTQPENINNKLVASNDETTLKKVDQAAAMHNTDDTAQQNTLKHNIDDQANQQLVAENRAESDIKNMIHQHLKQHELEHKVQAITTQTAQQSESTKVTINIIDAKKQEKNTAYQTAMQQPTDAAKIVALREFLNRYHNYDPAELSLISLLMQNNHLDEAKQLLQTKINSGSENTQYVLLLAHILTEQQQISPAITLLQKHQPNTFENNEEYYALLAALYLHDEKYIDAKNIYSALAKIDPSDARWWFGLGMSLQQLGRFNDAHAAFEKADQLANLPAKLQLYVNKELY